MDLSITNLEAERQRRQIAMIERAARMGAELPSPTFKLKMTHPPEGGYMQITVGSLEIQIHCELGRDPYTKQLVERVSNLEVERKVLENFPDETVAKKIFDHIFGCYEQGLKKENVRLHRYGNTKLSGGSSQDPYPEL